MREKLTKSDVEKIREEIEHRKLVERKELIEAVKEARSHGDLSENFEYHAAKKEKNRKKIEKTATARHFIFIPPYNLCQGGLSYTKKEIFLLLTLFLFPFGKNIGKFIDQIRNNSYCPVCRIIIILHLKQPYISFLNHQKG